MRFELAASRRTLRRSVGLLLAGLALAAASAAAQEGEGPKVQVIVNAANPQTELGRVEVSRWFLKQANTWPNGKVVVPLDQSSRSEVRAAFCLAVHRQSLAAIETYWQKQIFSGRTLPPFVKVGDGEVMAYVGSNPHAIGYVSASATLTGGVKAIRIKE